MLIYNYHLCCPYDKNKTHQIHTFPTFMLRCSCWNQKDVLCIIHAVFLQHNTQMMKRQLVKYLQNLHLMKAQTTIKNNTDKNENGMFLKTSTSSSPSLHPPDESYEPLSSSISRLRKKSAKSWDKETSRDGWSERMTEIKVLPGMSGGLLSTGVSFLRGFFCPSLSCWCSSELCFWLSISAFPSAGEDFRDRFTKLVCVCQSDCYAFVTRARCWSPKCWPLYCHYVALFL